MGSTDLGQFAQRAGSSGGGALATAAQFFSIVLTLALIVLVVIVIVRLLQYPGFPGCGAKRHEPRHPLGAPPAPTPPPAYAPAPSPETLRLLDILSERYARGEIDGQEYAAMREEFLRRDARTQPPKI